ncbi:hypothetical protein BOX15_Mlig028093g1, partial [Macrostomum lignano]
HSMAISAAASCLFSSLFSLLLFAGMQLFKAQLADSKLGTILGGGLGSLLFILLLTAVNNFENAFIQRGFQSQLFPEVVGSLVLACIASGMVHRVCITTCFIFSLVALYYVNSLSQKIYAAPVEAAAAAALASANSNKKKRK